MGTGGKTRDETGKAREKSSEIYVETLGFWNYMIQKM